MSMPRIDILCVCLCVCVLHVCAVLCVCKADVYKPALKWPHQCPR